MDGDVNLYQINHTIGRQTQRGMGTSLMFIKAEYFGKGTISWKNGNKRLKFSNLSLFDYSEWYFKTKEGDCDHISILSFITFLIHNYIA